ncbi:MAG: hypothetical protein ACRCW2_14155 [Cellulosilyticaceae bacterium]
MEQIIRELIEQGQCVIQSVTVELESGILAFNEWKKQVIMKLAVMQVDAKFQKELKFAMNYKRNPFDEAYSKTTLIEVIANSIAFLSEMRLEHVIKEDQAFSELVAVQIVKKVLSNFYLHIKAMYQDELHGRGTLTQKDLDQIKIGNEYDVQRMLYALLKPIFPTVRLEKNEDNGYGGMRYDLVLEDYQIVIEVKCSRTTMSEKSLTEEIGADMAHYHGKYLFFFIYDKANKLKNAELFEAAYSKTLDNKIIETYVIQPVVL